MNPKYGDWSNFQPDGCSHLRGSGLPALERVDREVLSRKRQAESSRYIHGDEVTRRGFKTDVITYAGMTAFLCNSPFALRLPYAPEDDTDPNWQDLSDTNEDMDVEF